MGERPAHIEVRRSDLALQHRAAVRVSFSRIDHIQRAIQRRSRIGYGSGTNGEHASGFAGQERPAADAVEFLLCRRRAAAPEADTEFRAALRALPGVPGT